MTGTNLWRTTLIVCCLTAGYLAAQAVPAAPPWTRGRLDFSGTLDVYDAWNGNHPASGVNQLLVFDDRAAQPTLNQIEAAIAMAPAPAGFEFDFGAGDIYSQLAQSEPRNPLRYVSQAYADFTWKELDRIRLDFGKFDTSAGESPETVTSFNYSRSLLFNWSQPDYHFGLRTSIPAGNDLTLGFQIVNGWDRTFEGNGFRTAAVTAAYIHGKFAWHQDFYTGPEPVGAGQGNGVRRLYDSTWSLNPLQPLKINLNLDADSQAMPLGRAAHWGGVALNVQWTTGRHFAFSPRWEYFTDPEGYATGAVQHVREVTLTGDWQVRRWALVRSEIRRDDSSVAFFERDDGARASHQLVGLISLVLYRGNFGQ